MQNDRAHLELMLANPESLPNLRELRHMSGSTEPALPGHHSLPMMENPLNNSVLAVLLWVQVLCSHTPLPYTAADLWPGQKVHHEWHQAAFLLNVPLQVRTEILAESARVFT